MIQMLLSQWYHPYHHQEPTKLKPGLGMVLGRRIYPLTNGSTIIGRREDCGILIENPAISRKHAAISVQDEKLVLTDLNSTNGTYVNDTPVHFSTVLSGGDRIRIANVEFVVAA
jgi:pSer/pThr/pTyr-binding forkhead associated (FHA) protein